jgi:hypothetical protein
LTQGSEIPIHPKADILLLEHSREETLLFFQVTVSNNAR